MTADACPGRALPPGWRLCPCDDPTHPWESIAPGGVCMLHESEQRARDWAWARYAEAQRLDRLAAQTAAAWRQRYAAGRAP